MEGVTSLIPFGKMLKPLVFSVIAIATLQISCAPYRAIAREHRSLSAFRSDAEVSAYLRNIAAERDKGMRMPTVGNPTIEKKPGARRLPRSAAAIVTGRVIDKSGKSLGGAQVLVPSLQIGGVTGSDGRYRLEIPATRQSQTQSLVVRRIGFSPVTYKLGLKARDSVELNFTLAPQTMTLQEVIVSGVAAKSDAITNTQHAGVDEGDIVKLRGDHLVILRRGRLFTVSIHDKSLVPISTIDAFGPGIDPRGAWYDELLVSEDKVVVIGFSYQRGGTEIGVFRIDPAGVLRHLATYDLRSNDYYSSRNYASRLIGNKLIFYSPLYSNLDTARLLDNLPAMRRWKEGDGDGDFERIVTPRRIYRPPTPLDPSVSVAFHTVTTCDLARVELSCQATVVIGPPGRVFYVSPQAVYIWTSAWRRGFSDGRQANILYRMPLDGSAPTALGVSGSPIDQFSFLESEDGYLNVVVRSEAAGDGMWRGERTAGTVALLRFPVASFGNGTRNVDQSRYRYLPTPVGSTFENRFVGEHLLYGTGNGWGSARADSSMLRVVSWKGGEVRELPLPHGIDRIEPMGENAVVIGSDGHNLHFSGVRLRRAPVIVQRYVFENAAQGELRSHGFFYKPDGPETGVLGLPVRADGQPGYSHLFRGSAAILFLRDEGTKFSSLGALNAGEGVPPDDGCRASCVDWYGNARPIFIRNRLFALLGYELVEGAYGDGRIREIGRVSFAPRVVRR